MKKYELKYTKGEDGVFCMSTVENPATKTQLVMFDDEFKKMEFQDDEKRVIYSVAMRPNMLIPRKDINGEPAMVFYSEETVNDLQQNFFKNNSHNGATINHDKNVRKDMYAFESWIVQDPEKDKAASLGLQVEKGDWVLGQKIDNPEIWNKVKKGELTGFSIEAYLEPVLTTKEIEMTKEEVDARIKAVIEMTAEEDAKKKADEEAAAAAEAEKVKMEGEGTPPPADDLQKKVDELTAENLALKAKLAEYEVKEVQMSAEIVAAKKVAVEMGAELAKGIKPNAGPQKAYHEMSNFEKTQFNKTK
jgi:hypothetical protein